MQELRRPGTIRSLAPRKRGEGKGEGQTRSLARPSPSPPRFARRPLPAARGEASLPDEPPGPTVGCAAYDRHLAIGYRPAARRDSMPARLSSNRRRRRSSGFWPRALRYAATARSGSDSLCVQTRLGG